MPCTDHPVVQQPENQDALVWRYMDLPRFLSLLSSRTLYFARGDKFEDPYEGQLPDEVLGNIKSHNIDNPQVFEMWRQFGKNSQYENYISCWYMADHESAAMWKLYSANGVGVAVVSTYSALKSSLDGTHQQVVLGLVKYGVEHLVNRKTMGNGYEYWYSKRKSFEHEREIRAVIWLPIGGTSAGFAKKAGKPVEVSYPVMTGRESPPGLSISVDLQALVHRVLVSPGSPSWVVPVVEDVMTKYALNCPVEQSKLYTQMY
jgi:hypothetical protein